MYMNKMLFFNIFKFFTYKGDKFYVFILFDKIYLLFWLYFEC